MVGRHIVPYRPTLAGCALSKSICFYNEQNVRDASARKVLFPARPFLLGAVFGARRVKLHPRDTNEEPMRDAILLGLVFGIGAALAVGPIFVTIIHEAATRGFGSSFRVILGSATADLILLVPALALSWIIARVGAASAWV